MSTSPTYVANSGRLELLFRALAHTEDPSKRGVSFGGAAAFCSSREEHAVPYRYPEASVLADPRVWPGSDLSYVGVSIYLRGHFPSLPYSPCTALSSVLLFLFLSSFRDTLLLRDYLRLFLATCLVFRSSSRRLMVSSTHSLLVCSLTMNGSSLRRATRFQA